MRVLIQSRKNFYELRGGDTVQLLKTKAELEKLGVEADISLEYEPDLSGYDLVHLSNLTRVQETWLQMRNAVRQRRPVLLSTIYWPMDEFEKKGQVGIRRVINSRLGIDNEERVKALARWLKDRNSRDRATRNLWKVGYTRMQRDVVRHVDYFLPNSEMEMEMLCRNLHLKKENYRVIPNAVDGEAACRLRGTAVPSEFERFRGAGPPIPSGARGRCVRQPKILFRGNPQISETEPGFLLPPWNGTGEALSALQSLPSQRPAQLARHAGSGKPGGGRNGLQSGGQQQGVDHRIFWKLCGILPARRSGQYPQSCGRRLSKTADDSAAGEDSEQLYLENRGRKDPGQLPRCP